MRLGLAAAGWLLSPTRRIIDAWKAGDASHRGHALRRWSVGLFWFEVGGCAALAFIFHRPASTSLNVLGLLVTVYSYSRINEIVYAFYSDALSASKESDLTPVERIRMAMRSYFGLAVNFALLYYFLPIQGLFKEPLKSFLESFYFSGVTLATLGYGDISPAHWISQLLALYQVFAGILIVAVAIASYVSSVRLPRE